MFFANKDIDSTFGDTTNQFFQPISNCTALASVPSVNSESYLVCYNNQDHAVYQYHYYWPPAGKPAAWYGPTRYSISEGGKATNISAWAATQYNTTTKPCSGGYGLFYVSDKGLETWMWDCGANAWRSNGTVPTADAKQETKR